MKSTKLAIICSHPIQYNAPWFRQIAQYIDLRVIYLWDFGVTTQADPSFQKAIQWDIPLLDGYDYEFIPNISKDPGTHHFRGLVNPSLTEALKRFDPDIVLVFGYAWQTILMYLLRHSRSLPVLVRGDSHRLSPQPPTISSRIRRFLTRYALSRCDGVLSVGTANREFFLEQGLPPSKIYNVPHCVDNDRFAQASSNEVGLELRKSLKIPEDHTLLTFVGKFQAKKRPDLLVSAFRKLAPSNSTLLLTGDGPMKSALEAIAGDDPKIRFLPFQNQSEMPSVYAASDVVVLPSQGNFETWGLVVNEAMNCRCAIVVSSHVGCGTDLVRPGDNGWIFQAGDLDELVETLKDALADRHRLRIYAENSLKRIQEFSYQVATQNLLQAIKTTLKQD